MELAVPGQVRIVAPVGFLIQVQFPIAALVGRWRRYNDAMPALVVVRLVAIAAPIFFMIALIPYVRNDFVLAAVYVAIIAISSFRYDRHDFTYLVIGCIVLFVSEYFFISTGVETFERKSLLGVMPLWLPLLWAYVFVAIKRGVLIIEKYLP